MRNYTAPIKIGGSSSSILQRLREREREGDVRLVLCSSAGAAAAASLGRDAGRPALLSGGGDGLGVRVSHLLARVAPPAADGLLRQPLLHVVSLSLAADVLQLPALQTGRLQEHQRQEDRESRPRHGGNHGNFSAPEYIILENNRESVDIVRP